MAKFWIQEGSQPYEIDPPIWIEYFHAWAIRYRGPNASESYRLSYTPPKDNVYMYLTQDEKITDWT